MKEKFSGIYKSFILGFNIKAAPFLQKLTKWLSAVNSLLSLGVIISFVYALGFNVLFSQVISSPLFIITFYTFFCEYTLSILNKLYSRNTRRVKRSRPVYYIIYGLVVLYLIIRMIPNSLVVSYLQFLLPLRQNLALAVIVDALSLLKLSTVLTRSLTNKLEPQWIMVGSFLILIIVGTCMLLLPRSTYNGISIIDSLFVTVSSVCVTGLTPIDIPSTFTLTGQIVILLLIQFGGIGIMTFTSFFGLMASGNHSAQNKLLIKDLIDPDNSVSQIFTTLRNIILITFLIELVGAWAIYTAMGSSTFYDFYVSLFQSISAFCNAGISIIPDGMYNEAIRDNYPLIHVVAWLIILGGIGFPILFNLWQWVKNSVILFFRRLLGKFSLNYNRRPHLLTSNTVIVIIVTAFLIISGTFVFMITEGHNILEGKSLWGKYSIAFFLSVSPRTAGFNAFPMGELLPVTAMFLIFYMWIGGSPMSTAGGIKTTTFGIAILNVWNTLHGRDQIEIRRRTIATQTTNRAFIIMFVSLVVIATGTMYIIILEPDKPILAIVFEVVSAFSTVGLSLDLTPLLCTGSKIVLICIMFIGRMGLLTILGCLVSKDSSHFYTYPSEHIPIN